MSWDDISDAQLAEVIGKSNDERARAVVGKVRAYYREQAEARVEALEEAARKYRRIYKAARKVVKSWEEDGPGGCTSIIITCELKDALAALVKAEEVESDGIHS